jgi:hypothetical protein
MALTRQRGAAAETSRWQGQGVEVDPCGRCAEPTPLSVNTVGPDGILCVECRLTDPPVAELPPPRWRLSGLLPG